MTPKREVLYIYPTAYSNKIVGHLVHIFYKRGKTVYLLSWGNNARQAWKNAETKAKASKRGRKIFKSWQTR